MSKSSPFKKLRHPVRVAKHIANLPRAHTQMTNKTNELHELFLKLNHLVTENTQSIANMATHNAKVQEELLHRLQLLDERLTDALHQISVMQDEAQAQPAEKSKKDAVKKSSDQELVADDHILDNLYVHFERWFRGTDEEIKKRQEVYLPYFTESKLNSKKTPVVDIGCGRGEFVQLLQEHKIRAIGMDLNKTMVEHVKKKGLEAVQADALSYLKEQPANSLMAITGFHIVEHIPFVDLVRIFNECYRALAPGGFVVFETPNPENVIVGSCNFYNDPSHLHPLPPSFLELVMKTRGFPKTEIKRLHPIKAKIDSKDPLVKEMAERFYGPQDYAVIAHK